MLRTGQTLGNFDMAQPYRATTDQEAWGSTQVLRLQNNRRVFHAAYLDICRDVMPTDHQAYLLYT